MQTTQNKIATTPSELAPPHTVGHLAYYARRGCDASCDITRLRAHVQGEASTQIETHTHISTQQITPADVSLRPSPCTDGGRLLRKRTPTATKRVQTIKKKEKCKTTPTQFNGGSIEKP